MIYYKDWYKLDGRWVYYRTDNGCSYTEEVYRWVWNPVGSHKHLKGLDRHANKINKKKADEIINIMKMTEELKK